MNHIGDTNKMVSDTPRTNARVKRMIDNDQGPEGLEYWARDLERELNAATSEVERLTKKIAQLYEGAEEQCQRIKRLEEAGDRMRLFCADPDDCFAWDKAKEASK